MKLPQTANIQDYLYWTFFPWLFIVVTHFLLSTQIALFHPKLSMINDLLSSCQPLNLQTTHVRTKTSPCAGGGWDWGVFHAPVSTGQIHRTLVCDWIAHSATQCVTLPEQSSYLTSRPQKGFVFPHLGWTWRSTELSCWWSGRYTDLWRGGGGWGGVKPPDKYTDFSQR